MADDDAPAYVVDAQLVSDVQGYAQETERGSVHVERWNRVLVAFGVDVSGFSGAAMTATEAQTYADKGWTRWDPVVVALRQLESQPADPPLPTPEVSITGGAGVVEGSAVSFTVTADPPSASPLNVDLVVSPVGDWGLSTLPGQVTVPTTGSVTFTILTADDSVDESNGSLTATLSAGNGYTVSSTHGSATVAVADDDSPPPPPIPVVSISGGAGVVEGGSAVFTVSASPKPASSLAVTVTVAAQGDYGVQTGSRTVTVPVSGSVSFAVATAGDSTDEPDGSVTATLVDGGADYDLAAAKSATVTVADDDVPPPPTPVVSISGGAGVVEGGSAVFTVSASPKPASPLAVTVTVASQGDYGVTVGSQTVTIPVAGTATLSVATSGDSADEPDGSVTATLVDGADYDLGAAKSATVAVSDDDDPPTPVVSISGGAGVVEGGSAVFTVSASPKPASPLAVTVTVASQGDYGVTVGSQTVTIPVAGTATLSVATSGDSADEPDGSVTATLVDGADYDLGAAKSATVAVSDDDDPPPPLPGNSGTLTVSVSHDGARTGRGEMVVFDIGASDTAQQDVTIGFWLRGDRGLVGGLDYCLVGPGDADPEPGFRCSDLDVPADHDHDTGQAVIAEGDHSAQVRVWISANAWIFDRALLFITLTELDGAKAITAPNTHARVVE